MFFHAQQCRQMETSVKTLRFPHSTGTVLRERKKQHESFLGLFYSKSKTLCVCLSIYPSVTNVYLMNYDRQIRQLKFSQTYISMADITTNTKYINKIYI